MSTEGSFGGVDFNKKQEGQEEGSGEARCHQRCPARDRTTQGHTEIVCYFLLQDVFPLDTNMFDSRDEHEKKQREAGQALKRQMYSSEPNLFLYKC